MRVSSRGFCVGFLLVLALGASGCQPVQPVSGAPAAVASESATETISITVTQAMSESVVASSTVTSPSDSTPLTETTAVTVSNEITVTSGNATSAPDADPALLATGLTIYRAQYCGVCHTLDAAETRGTFGPPHNGMGEIAATRLADGTYQGAATTPAEYIHESIVDPQAYTVPGFAATSHRMPVYAHLDAASLDALVAFLLAN